MKTKYIHNFSQKQNNCLYIFDAYFPSKGKLPAEGWNDLSIRHLLNEVALMDSNNFPSKYVYATTQAGCFINKDT